MKLRVTSTEQTLFALRQCRDTKCATSSVAHISACLITIYQTNHTRIMARYSSYVAKSVVHENTAIKTISVMIRLKQNLN